MLSLGWGDPRGFWPHLEELSPGAAQLDQSTRNWGSRGGSSAVAQFGAALHLRSVLSGHCDRGRGTTRATQQATQLGESTWRGQSGRRRKGVRALAVFPSGRLTPPYPSSSQTPCGFPFSNNDSATSPRAPPEQVTDGCWAPTWAGRPRSQYRSDTPLAEESLS